MTWKEFKDEAEKQCITDDMEIHYIDVTFPTAEEMRVSPQGNEGDDNELGFIITG